MKNSHSRSHKLVFLILPALILGAVLAATQASGDESNPASDRGAQVANKPAQIHQTKKRAKLRLSQSRYGKILVDNQGRTLYIFTKEARGAKPACYSDCAAAWPPFKTKRMPRAGAGVKKGKLGVKRRRSGGKQVTYNGRPLYYYRHEVDPGQIFCQDVVEFGGTWLVADRNGRPVR